MDDIRSRIERELSGSYTFERELGGGGMSRTYLTTETALGRQVVIKVLAPELLAGVSVERFRREVLVAARLQHPHVVPVLTSGEVNGVPWFSMPYVDGESLRQRLASGPLPVGETVSLLRDVARALAYAHRHGIVHRDIKPDNVLVSSGSATVTDFGIAKAISAARTRADGAQSTLTQAGTAIGTPAYMSPEQVLGEEVDNRTDIYSFGVMAWELLAGHAPFRAESSAKLIAAHLSEMPQDISDIRPDCPPQLAALVMHCLAKDAADRPQTAQELAQLLDESTTGHTAEGARSGSYLERMNGAKALALWITATAGVVLIARVATHTLGLPDWVLPGALAVMLLGAPAVLLTAYVQRARSRASRGERRGSRPEADGPPLQNALTAAALKAGPYVSWRRTWLGGAVAVGGFALLVAGYMTLRAMGIGPMATLQARGDFGEQETLLIADFRSPSNDPDLGPTVAEALRTDLGQSRALQVVSRTELREMLDRMQRSEESVVHFNLARQLATREGAKAVLDGEVMRVGQGYVLSARLVSALDGRELATFRREARSEADLLPELGRLSRAVRERAGESLRDIRASNSIERVTTPSLEALRKYVEGMRAYSEEGDLDGAMVLLQQSVEQDTAFAMAWRAMATVAAGQWRADRYGLVMDYLSRAYRHRDRLTDYERLLTEGTYFSTGPEHNLTKALEAYEGILRMDSTNAAALNNTATIRVQMKDYEGAERYFRAAIAQPETFGGSYSNLVRMQIRNGRSAASVDSTIAELRERIPGSAAIPYSEVHAAWAARDYERADSVARRTFNAAPDGNNGSQYAFLLADLAAIRGRPNEALRWYSTQTDLAYDAGNPVGRRMTAAVDSIYYYGVSLGNTDLSTAIGKRALTETNLDDLPPLERPWSSFLDAAVELHDSSMAQAAAAGYLRDWLPLMPDSAAQYDKLMAQVKHASGEWDEAIRLYHAALESNGIPPRYYLRWVGMAHDAAGRADSAVVWFERYIADSDPDLHTAGNYLPRVHRRLGELYEDRGDVERAIVNYSAFVEYWREAEPALQPEVEEARRRVERLRAARG